MNPGIYREMPFDEYLSIPAISAIGLKLMKKSPAHFYGVMLDPNRPDEKSSPALINGTLVHCALFEPSEVENRYVVRPDGMSFTTKDGKAWRDAQTRIIVSADQMAAARLQSERIRELPELAHLLSAGFGESSVFWIDGPTGELCKCRPDWVYPLHAGGSVILIDGKTCQDASPEKFSRSIWNYGYYLQAAHYCDGFERATGDKVLGFVFAAIESSWPHQAAAYMLGDDVLDAARRENRRLIDRYATCKRSNWWPGYPSSISLIELPSWANLENPDA